jgi:ArsR family transcriptional regulator
MSTVVDERLPVLESAVEACCPSFLTSTVSEAEAMQAARIFKALADPARVRLLSLIAGAGLDGACVCELVPPLDLSQPTVSHHLRILQEAGLVSRERRGTWAYFRIKQDAITVVARALQV